MTASTPVPEPEVAAAASNDNAQSELAREAAKVHVLVEQLGTTDLGTVAEMLGELRRAFPDSPLAVRVRALQALRRR